LGFGLIFNKLFLPCNFIDQTKDNTCITYLIVRVDTGSKIHGYRKLRNFYKFLQFFFFQFCTEPVLLDPHDASSIRPPGPLLDHPNCCHRQRVRREGDHLRSLEHVKENARTCCRKCYKNVTKCYRKCYKNVTKCYRNVTNHL